MDVINEMHSIIRQVYKALYNYSEHEYNNRYRLGVSYYEKDIKNYDKSDLYSMLALFSIKGLADNIVKTKEELHKAIKNSEYIVYENNDTFTFIYTQDKIVVKTYKTNNIKEIIYLLSSKIIDKEIWDLMVDMYADAHEVYYDEESLEFETEVYNKVYSALPEYLKQYRESQEIENNFNELLESKEYNQWLETSIG